MNHPIREAFGTNGQKYVLGKELGSGGEGAVYEVISDSDRAVKIYHAALSSDRAEKIRVMSRMATAQISKLTAWPLDLLCDRSGKRIGLLMPRISGRHDIHRLYSPKSRRTDFQQADWRFLIRAAANAARVMAAIHEMGCVIGDVNERSVLVGQDATVRLIDCDSFQVAAAGRRFICDVGVETFTPPELQGKSFKTVVRTENNDYFGLGVLIFLLLFMGRHPFAGRYTGRGDMPIPKAIEESRFAYGIRRTDANMERPPGTPPLTIVGDDVATLFELAFSKQLIDGGRPSAKEWAASLAQLESHLRQCSANASHWYLRAAPQCPWCQMEGATGIALFGFALRAPTASFFNLDALWREVESLGNPGPAPTLAAITLQSSVDARAVGFAETRRNVIGGVAALLLAGIAISGYAKGFGIILFGLAIAAFFATRALFDNSEGMQRYKTAFQNADAKWKVAQREWETKAGATEFDAKKSSMVELRRQLQGISAERLRRLDQLNQDRREHQLAKFLDQFEINDATIENIGAGRKRTLESYGIETAADIVASKIQGIPGFGPRLRSNLIAWRDKIESRFRFDPNKAVDSAEITRVDSEILAKQKGLQTQLTAGLAELRALANRIDAVRRGMRSQIDAIQREYAQATADVAAVTRRS